MRMVIGVIVVLLCVVGGFTAMGGHPGVLWQPWEIVIILGGAIGGYIVMNSKHVLMDTIWAIGSLFKKAPYSKEDYLELLTMLYVILRQGQKGLDAMAGDFDEPEKSAFFAKFPKIHKNHENLQFVADYLRLIQLGTKKGHELADLMDEEIETIRHELFETPKAIQTGMADALPALGIVAAITGVVKAMGYITAAPEVLGHMIGGALVGTLMGIMLSYSFFGPVAAAVKTRREAMLTYYVCIKAGLIAYLNGSAPQISMEYARKVIPFEVRPTFFEVEKAMQAAKMSA